MDFQKVSSSKDMDTQQPLQDSSRCSSDNKVSFIFKGVHFDFQRYDYFTIKRPGNILIHFAIVVILSDNEFQSNVKTPHSFENYITLGYSHHCPIAKASCQV